MECLAVVVGGLTSVSISLWYRITNPIRHFSFSTLDRSIMKNLGHGFRSNINIKLPGLVKIRMRSYGTARLEWTK